jgi:hypothetical protein
MEENFKNQVDNNVDLDEVDDVYQDDYEDCATEEDMILYFKTQGKCCYFCSNTNSLDIMLYDGIERVMCNICFHLVNRCSECNTLTIDNVYHIYDFNIDLCFDCKFNTLEHIQVQMPLETHLAVRSYIQKLPRKYFDILVDYAELCEFTIFDAYFYKSRCHYYDCKGIISPSVWDSEEQFQFCCRRHRELSDDIGCHIQYVYYGTEYNGDYEEAICKLCNSSHEINMIPRMKYRHENIKNIVSVISIFQKIFMSNVLSEVLVDLCQYFG